MPDVIGTVEDAVLARLQAPLEALRCRVEGFPSGMPAPLARINSYYEGSDFSGPQLMQQMAQDEKLQVTLVLQLTDQRDKKAARPFLEAIRKYLTGFNALGKGDPGYLRRIRIQSLRDEKSDSWGYVIVFEQPHFHKQERV